MSLRERSDAHRALANHWLNMFKPSGGLAKEGLELKPERGATEIIDLETTSDESDEEVLELSERPQFKKARTDDILSRPIFESSKLTTPSPIHVFNTTSLQPPHSESMESFFNSNLLKETFIFSFELDIEFIALALKNPYKTRVIVLSQNLYNFTQFPQYEYVRVDDIIGPWSTHHSKLVINFYEDDTMQVFVSTSNFTPAEYGALGGVFWKSDLLLMSTPSDSTNQSFKIDLCNYLTLYKKQQTTELIEKIKLFDFSGVKASFVGSTPGISKGDFGYLKLHKVLKDKHLFPDLTKSHHYKFLAQSSTIGGPFSYLKGEPSNILTHVLLPLVMNKPFPMKPGELQLRQFMHLNNVEPMILFPTTAEVLCARDGLTGAGPLIYNSISKNGSLQDAMISKIFHKRNKLEVGSPRTAFYKNGIKVDNDRGGKLGPDDDATKPFVNNHSKIYIFTEDDFETLNWCFIGSMNISKAAWGSPTGSPPGTSLRGVNWECGVLLDPKDYNSTGKFVPVFNENTSHKRETAIRLPFMLPLEKYDSHDKAWCRFEFLEESRD